ncbi:gp201 [Sphingomonas phage PAU]|uniref:gp201 n=1 Tax=Sphingomonas phage PAU TaxID=1150991 RepID=UPI0002573367|nr:gp201 [Sphingomonas phage PAU]AFF28199.1 gp201 [Sphingomonas phage PAU]
MALLSMSNGPKQTLNVNYALETLRNSGIDAMKHCFKLTVMTDNGYEEVKTFTHKSIQKCYVVTLAGGKSFTLSELLHLQKELKQARIKNNESLNCKKVYRYEAK